MVLVKISKKKIDFFENVEKFRFHSNFPEKNRFWSQFSKKFDSFENFDCGKIFKKFRFYLKFSKKVDFFENFEKFRFWSNFRKKFIWIIFSKNFDFKQISKKKSILVKILATAHPAGPVRKYPSSPEGIKITVNKSDGKRRNTLGCLNQYTCNMLRLWNSRDRETV